MRRRAFDLTTLTFKGPRFEDHGLDIEVLPELIAYKNLLVAMAKHLYLQHRPERERVQKGFEGSINIKFYGIGQNCCTVPLKRVVEFEDDHLIMQPDDEIEEAAELIDLGIDAASSGQPLPENFPRDVLEHFDDFGRTLTEGHSIALKARKCPKEVCYTPEVRDRLVSWIERVYEDNVDLKGEIRLADLDGCKFRIRLDDGSKIDGRFEPDQEALITDALHEHTTRRLRVQGTAEYRQSDRKIRCIRTVRSINLLPVGDDPYDPTARPIWERVTEIGKRIPEDERRRMPTDASKNLDHYLYGVPKSEK